MGIAERKLAASARTVGQDPAFFSFRRKAPDIIFIINEHFCVIFSPARNAIRVGFVGDIVVLVSETHREIVVQPDSTSGSNGVAVPAAVLAVEPNDVLSGRRQADWASDVFSHFPAVSVLGGNNINVLKGPGAPLRFYTPPDIRRTQGVFVVGFIRQPDLRELFVGQWNHPPPLLGERYGKVIP